MRRPCGQGQPTPCYKDGKHCEKRYPGCQPKCPEYMAFWQHNVEVVYPAREKKAEINYYSFEEKLKSKKRGGRL